MKERGGEVLNGIEAGRQTVGQLIAKAKAIQAERKEAVQAAKRAQADLKKFRSMLPFPTAEAAEAKLKQMQFDQQTTSFPSMVEEKAAIADISRLKKQLPDYEKVPALEEALKAAEARVQEISVRSQEVSDLIDAAKASQSTQEKHIDPPPEGQVRHVRCHPGTPHKD
eukprot:gnl/Ergobibamus_cyprinoides/1024.p2 GENE.gnl/Ergobibamus_cyprinoides/1024~~gnl/Ergobibamus_cyprinoides/1024.p2  ORF type:complete len:168 (+),score=74.38 gnl/Ergobibamus_cyprinoides/1024:213-716(+)